MKLKNLLTVLSLVLSANCFAISPLNVTGAIWDPSPNVLPIADLSAPNTETYDLGSDYAGTKISIQHGGRAAFGCDLDIAVNNFMWLAVNPAGEVAEMNEVKINEIFTLKEGFHYLLAATIDNLSSCQGYSYSFIALKR